VIEGPHGTPQGKTDFRDAKRSVSRLLSDDLILSYVPDAEQRGWRTLTRTKYQLRRDRVRLQSQLESLLEECQIKLSSVVSDLLGASGQRILCAIAAGETDPARLRTRAHRECSHAETTEAKARHATRQARIFGSANTDSGPRGGFVAWPFFEGVARESG
jgi:transposase